MKLPEKAQESLDKVIDMFKSGDLPEAIARTAIEGEGKPSDDWSFRNQIVMYANETTDARGYKQWQKVGRQVEKGASALHIFGPIIKTVEEENDDGETKEKEKLVGFRTIPVFRYEDTEGDEISYDPAEPPPLKSVADVLGYDIRYYAKNGNSWGSTVPDYKTIELNTDAAESFFHELAHAVESEMRDINGGQHSDQEIVAEGVAAALCEMYGFEGYLQQANDYIESYADGDAYDAIIQYLKRIEEVLNHVFELAVEADIGVAFIN